MKTTKKIPQHPDGFRLFCDQANEWRWQLWRKGRIIAVSGEGYQRIAKCRAAVRSVRTCAAIAPLVRRSVGEIMRES